MCRFACGLHSRWRRARNSPRRHDFICCPQRRWYSPTFLKTLLSDLYLDVFRAMSEAIAHIARGEHDPHSAHQRIRGFYDWTRVAERTETVYRDVLATPPYPLWTRIQRCVPVSHSEQNSGDIDTRQDHELGPICWPHLHNNTSCRLFVFRVPRMVDA